MLWLLFSTIMVLVLLVSVSFLIVWKMTQSNHKLSLKLLDQNQTLVNLATAKNLEAYTQIQAVQQMETASSESVLPMDDTSVALRMQKDYEEAGMDPSLAINTDDLTEFGGINQFRAY